MKKKMTLALASSILTLTLSAFPHRAAASTASAAPPPDSQLTRASGDKPVKYMELGLVADILSSVLLP